MIETTTFVFTVSMRPPYDISPNASRKVPVWITRKERSAWRSAWYNAIITGLEEAQGTPGMVSMPTEPIIAGEAACHITYYRERSAKQWDGDNLLAVCKVGIDQLESTGIISNDRDLVFAPIRQFEALPGTPARMEVRLVPRQVEDDGDDRQARVRDVLRDLMAHVEAGYRLKSISTEQWTLGYGQIVNRLHDVDLIERRERE
jgi:hypothetical protein